MRRGERGDRPLEIVTSRQWYIRNGGRDTDLRAALVARGGEVTWHPTHMQHPSEDWLLSFTAEEMGFDFEPGDVADLVLTRAARAFEAGADGVIASPQEAAPSRLTAPGCR